MKKLIAVAAGLLTAAAAVATPPAAAGAATAHPGRAAARGRCANWHRIATPHGAINRNGTCRCDAGLAFDGAVCRTPRYDAGVRLLIYGIFDHPLMPSSEGDAYCYSFGCTGFTAALYGTGKVGQMRLVLTHDLGLSGAQCEMAGAATETPDEAWGAYRTVADNSSGEVAVTAPCGQWAGVRVTARYSNTCDGTTCTFQLDVSAASPGYKSSTHYSPYSYAAP